MTETARLRLPLIAAAQAQKHVTHNEALTALDTLVQASVLDKDLSAPPSTPSEGDCYIVASGGSGAWSGLDTRIVRHIDGVWRSYLPGSGWLAYVEDEAQLYLFDGTNWAASAGGGGVSTASPPVVSGNLVRYADTTGDVIEDSGVSTSDLQPLDADLTAIAALSTQGYGRSLLTLADAAALRSAGGLVVGTDVQAFDADLAAIAALSTTSFGRSLLALADANALLATLGTWRVLAASAVAASHTGSTAETTLATITVPGNAMGPNGILRITLQWGRTGTAGTMTPKVYFGGLAGTLYHSAVVGASNLSLRHQIQIANRNAANSQIGHQGNHANNGGWQQSTTAAITSALDTTSSQDIVITAQLNTAGDTMRLEAYLVELLHKA